MKRLLFLFAMLIAGTAQAADTGQLIIPSIFGSDMSASWDNHNLDASTDALEWQWQCEEACTIDSLCYRYGARTGTPPTYQISLQGVASTGRADGTIKSSTNAKATFTPPANTTQDDTFQCKTLTSGYACTKGEFLSTVIGYSSGTISGANFGSFSYGNGNDTDLRFPSPVTVDAGTGTRRSGGIPWGYKCGSTFYGPQYQSAGQMDFGADSTPDERGNIFTIPAASCDTFKLDKATFKGYIDSAGSTLTLVVYEGTTVRQDVVIDGDLALSGGWSEGVFEEGYTFACGTAYRIVVKPQANGGTKAGLWKIDFASAGAQNSLPLGTSMYYTSRTDAGAFTDTDTSRAVINLSISDITEPSAGGVSVPRKLKGGFQ